MKFKEFLQEKASYNRTVVELMSMSKIPLTDKITKALGFGRNVKTLHATTVEHLNGLSKLGKSKKQISTFTHGLGSLIGAISVRPDVVAVLDGRSVIDFDFDIFSHPDQQGRRWIGTRGSQKSEFLQEAINTKTINLMYDYLQETLSTDKKSEYFPVKYNYTKDKFLDDMLNDDFNYVKFFNMLSGKQKANTIKMYFDTIQNLMKNKMYIDIVKEIIASSNKKVGSYDEIIMNQFKVIGVYSIEAGRFQYDTSMAQFSIEKEGHKYLGHISKEEFNSFSV